MATPPIACPVCAALLLPGATSTHIRWHEDTGTLDGWVAAEADRLIRDNAAAVAALMPAMNAGPVRDDEAPTRRFPPIAETVLRRPPPPSVRELKGAELLRALADEMDRGTFDDPPPCEAGVVAGRECRWPADTPCLGYGVPGCGMKAQES